MRERGGGGWMQRPPHPSLREQPISVSATAASPCAGHTQLSSAEVASRHATALSADRRVAAAVDAAARAAATGTAEKTPRLPAPGVDGRTSPLPPLPPRWPSLPPTETEVTTPVDEPIPVATISPVTVAASVATVVAAATAVTAAAAAVWPGRGGRTDPTAVGENPPRHGVGGAARASSNASSLSRSCAPVAIGTAAATGTVAATFVAAVCFGVPPPPPPPPAAGVAVGELAEGLGDGGADAPNRGVRAPTTAAEVVVTRVAVPPPDGGRGGRPLPASPPSPPSPPPPSPGTPPPGKTPPGSHTGDAGRRRCRCRRRAMADAAGVGESSHPCGRTGRGTKAPPTPPPPPPPLLL